MPFSFCIELLLTLQLTASFGHPLLYYFIFDCHPVP
jgi:hypothetical protein